jgi:ParB family chromosome partitioning protein
VDIDLLSPSNEQPRVSLDEGRLDELAASIRSNGVIQPVIVRRIGNAYRIIAGERRWRAAQRAGLLKVPVIVRDIGEGRDQQLLELALVENLQREDLNPIDQARAYQRLIEEFGRTQEQVAAAVGKDRTSIANYLRLLTLPEEVRGNLSSGEITMGHAKALLALSSEASQRQAAREVITRSLSVRETESMVKHLGAPARTPKAAASVEQDVHTRAAEERLRFALGTKVRIVRRGAGGAIHIEFTSEAELNRLYDHLTR